MLLLLITIFFLGIYTHSLTFPPKSSESRSLSKHIQEPGLNPCGATTVPTRLSTPLIGTPLSLRKYISWHKRARQCLDDPNCAEKPDVLVWNCGPKAGCSGLGDRIRGIAAMFFLSVVSDRAFFIDWPDTSSDPIPLTFAMVPSVIDWRPPRYVRDMLQERNEDEGFLQASWRKERDENNNLIVIPGKSGWDIRNSSLSPLLSDISVLAVDYRPGWSFLSLLRKNEELTRQHADLRFDIVDTMNMHKILLQTLFTPTAAVQERMDGVVPPNTPPFVSVHARLGDDVDESERGRFDEHREKSRPRIAEELLSCVSKQIEDTGEERVVFLASDSTPFKQVFLDKAAESNVRVLTSGIRAMTMAHNGVHMADEDQEIERCEGFLNIFVDLFLLARGHTIVSMRSGFPRASFFLGGSSAMYHGFSPSKDFYCSDVSQ